MTGFAFRSVRERQAVRLPISKYEQAIRRLVRVREDESLSDDAYAVAVELVADIYWLTDSRVRRDVILAAKELG